jgi:hypothetical protein
VPDGADPVDRSLPADVRRRLDQFVQRVDRLRVEDLPMFAVRPFDQVEYDESLSAVTRAAFDSGRRRILDDGHRSASQWLDRLLSQQQFYPEWAVPSMGRSVGTAGDQAHLRRSLRDAISALVLWDVLDEVHRDHLIGPWAALIEGQ